MHRYMLNQKKPKGKLKVPDAVSENRLGKPRATNAIELFGNDQMDQIKKKLNDAPNAEEYRMDGGKRLTAQRELRAKLWDTATPEVRAGYEARALEIKEMIRKGAMPEDIQKCVV